MTSGFARDPAWFFEPKRRDKAVASLQYYFKSFTGSHFEGIADHDNPNRITARDIVAVSMLGVDIPAQQSKCTRFGQVLRRRVQIKCGRQAVQSA